MQHLTGFYTSTSNVLVNKSRSKPKKEKNKVKNDLPIKNSIVIPGHELEISTSRASGPGGQHVNKTNTRVTLRWSIRKTSAFSETEKQRVTNKLQTELTTDGEIVIHSGSSRSLEQNKKIARSLLVKKLRKALHVPKKRMKTRIPKAAKEARLKQKKRRGELKKMRGGKIRQD